MEVQTFKISKEKREKKMQMAINCDTYELKRKKVLCKVIDI
jgi:hypothetical protein